MTDSEPRFEALETLREIADHETPFEIRVDMGGIDGLLMEVEAIKEERGRINFVGRRADVEDHTSFSVSYPMYDDDMDELEPFGQTFTSVETEGIPAEPIQRTVTGVEFQPE